MILLKHPMIHPDYIYFNFLNQFLFINQKGWPSLLEFISKHISVLSHQQFTYMLISFWFRVGKMKPYA